MTITEKNNEKHHGTGNSDFNNSGGITPIRENTDSCPAEIKVCQGVNILSNIEKRILQGDIITFDEAINLEQLPTDRLPELLETAQRVTHFYTGRAMDLCSIVNAKSGSCSEDCKFCAQSAHWQTGITESLPDQEMILNRAHQMEAVGVKSYSLVTAGRGLTGKYFEKILEIFTALQDQTSLKLCASLGILDEEQLRRLKDCGVTTYHHNLESSRSFYQQICTTHS